jgi:glycine amidinotransferase
MEVVPIPYEKVIPFGGALHCTTLDVYREGTCEDYFPKQIPGY